MNFIFGSKNINYQAKVEKLDMNIIMHCKDMKKIIKSIQEHANSIVSQQRQIATKQYQIVNFLKVYQSKGIQLTQIWSLTLLLADKFDIKQFLNIVKANVDKQYYNFKLYKERLVKFAQTYQNLLNQQKEIKRIMLLINPIFQQIRQKEKLKKSQDVYYCVFKVCELLINIKKQNSLLNDYKSNFKRIHSYNLDEKQYKQRINLLYDCVLFLSKHEFAKFQQANLRNQASLASVLTNIYCDIKTLDYYQQFITKLKCGSQENPSINCGDQVEGKNYSILGDLTAHLTGITHFVNYLITKLIQSKPRQTLTDQKQKPKLIYTKEKDIFWSTLKPLQNLQTQINKLFIKKTQMEQLYQDLRIFYHTLKDQKEVPISKKLQRSILTLLNRQLGQFAQFPQIKRVVMSQNVQYIEDKSFYLEQSRKGADFQIIKKIQTLSITIQSKLQKIKLNQKRSIISKQNQKNQQKFQNSKQIQSQLAISEKKQSQQVDKDLNLKDQAQAKQIIVNYDEKEMIKFKLENKKSDAVSRLQNIYNIWTQSIMKQIQEIERQFKYLSEKRQEYILQLEKRICYIINQNKTIDLKNVNNQKLKAQLTLKMFLKQLKEIQDQKEFRFSMLRSLKYYKQSQQQITKLNFELQKLEQQIPRLKNKIFQLQQRIKVLQSQNLQMKGQIQELKKSKQKLQNELKEAYIRIQELLKEIERLKKQIQDMRNQLQMIKRSYSSQIEKYRQKIIQQQNQIADLKGKLKQEENKNKQLSARISQFADNHCDFIYQLKQKLKQKQVNQQKSQTQNNQNVKIQFMKNLSKQILQGKLGENHNMVLNQIQLKISALNNKIAQLEQFSTTKQSKLQEIKLLTHIPSERFTEIISGVNLEKSNVTKYNLIYRFSENKEANFSKFTKDKKNLLMICKTNFGQIIGGYTSQGFGNDKFNNDGAGFIFSGKYAQNSTEQIQFYYLKSSDKTPSQSSKDQIKFGYRQIVIKGGNIETDWATPRHESRGHYSNPNKHPKQHFLKVEQQGFAQIIDYEIYQISFDTEVIVEKAEYDGLVEKVQTLKNWLQKSKLELLVKQKQIQQLRATLIKVTDQLNLSNQKNQQNLNKIEEINKQLSKQKQSNNNLENSLSYLKTKIETDNKENIQKQSKIQQQFNQKQKQLKENIQELEKKIKEQSDLIQKLKNSENQLKQKVKSLTSGIDWKEKYESEVLSGNKLKNQVQKLSAQLQQQIASSLKQKEQILAMHTEQINKFEVDKQKVIQKFRDQIASLKDMKTSLEFQMNSIKMKQKNKSQQISLLQKKLASNRLYELYFQGDVFDSQPYDQLVWFVDQLQKNCEMRIRKTRLLYRKDDYSNVNFHVYFDNLQDIVLVIKLKNGMVLAGYTHPAFIKGQKQPGQTGFIFSFHTRQVFGQKRQGVQSMDPRPRPITYDEYYMIFGNSQIRLRFRQDMLFSNFGIMGAFYDNKKQPVNCLLGEDKQRESQILTYEIFQVKF